MSPQWRGLAKIGAKRIGNSEVRIGGWLMWGRPRVIRRTPKLDRSPCPAATTVH